MPGFGGQLSEVPLAAVANYVRNSWGHAAAAISVNDSGQQRTALKRELVPTVGYSTL